MSESEYPETDQATEPETTEPARPLSVLKDKKTDDTNSSVNQRYFLLPSLLTIERVMVTAAAAAAFLPIVQYIQETGERRLFRYATVANSIETCRSLLESPPGEVFDVPHMGLPIIVKDTDVRLMCHHIYLEYSKVMRPLQDDYSIFERRNVCAALEIHDPDNVPSFCSELLQDPARRFRNR